MQFLRQSALVIFAIIALTVGAVAQTTTNPINGSAPIAHWSFLLEDVVQIPNSSGSAPRLELLTGSTATGMAYVIDQRGPIYSFDPTAANPTQDVFLDLRTAVGSLITGNESGVRGMAFHPDFNNVGTAGYRKMYVSFSRTTGSATVGNPVIMEPVSGASHHTVISEWTVNGDDSVDLGSYRELIRVVQPFGNHNSGHIGFDPTLSPNDNDYGNLYIAVGDGGSSNGPDDMSQNLSFAHGKILRIDPIAAESAPYTIPDNPFVGQANVVEETWAYGLRNPHKFDWDAVTGEMYISDIGQGTVEEISVGARGANYGWNDREGAYVFVSGSSVSPLPPGHASDPFTYPVAQYDHSGSNDISGSSAIVGGSVYRGDEVPELTGMYLFAEFATNPGPIFAVDIDDLIQRDDFSNIANLNDGRLSPYVEVEIRDGEVDKDFRQFLRDANNNSGISRTNARWGVGLDGEIYLLNKQDGMVRRIAGVVGLAPGDANRDNVVDGADRARWEAAFGLAGDWSDANFNAGPVTDGDDFILWQRNAGGTPTTQSIPEPITLTLVILLIYFPTAALQRMARPHANA